MNRFKVLIVFLAAILLLGTTQPAMAQKKKYNGGLSFMGISLTEDAGSIKDKLKKKGFKMGWASENKNNAYVAFKGFVNGIESDVDFWYSNDSKKVLFFRCADKKRYSLSQAKARFRKLVAQHESLYGKGKSERSPVLIEDYVINTEKGVISVRIANDQSGSMPYWVYVQYSIEETDNGLDIVKLGVDMMSNKYRYSETLLQKNGFGSCKHTERVISHNVHEPDNYIVDMDKDFGDGVIIHVQYTGNKDVAMEKVGDYPPYSVAFTMTSGDDHIREFQQALKENDFKKWKANPVVSGEMGEAYYENNKYNIIVTYLTSKHIRVLFEEKTDESDFDLLGSAKDFLGKPWEKYEETMKKYKIGTCHHRQPLATMSEHDRMSYNISNRHLNHIGRGSNGDYQQGKRCYEDETIIFVTVYSAGYHHMRENAKMVQYLLPFGTKHLRNRLWEGYPKLKSYILDKHPYTEIYQGDEQYNQYPEGEVSVVLYQVGDYQVEVIKGIQDGKMILTIQK